MKISLYDRPPVLDTEGAFDDSDLLQRFEQRAMEFNRPGGFVDALRKGTAGLLRSFVAPNNIEADRLTALIGNEQERLNDPIGREMSQAQWDAYMRENAQSATNPNFFGLRSLADYIEPTSHAEPDNLLGKAAYKAGEYIPGIAGSVAEFMTLGPWGTILLNTVLGGQASQQQVYENQLAQGKSTQEARDIAEGFLGNAADFAVRGGTNLATLWALGRAYPGFQSGISPVGHTLRNIGLASGISGAGAMGEEALTNYRSDKDNSLGNLAETGATSAATTGIIGLTLAGLRAKKLIDAQREYNAYQGLHNVEWRDITPPDTPDEPLGLGDSNNPQPPNNPPQSPNGTLALPQGTLQLPEFTTRNIAARLNKAVTQRGFNPITNDFQPNALARQIAAYVGNGYMSMDDALSMLQEGGLSPDDAKGFLDTGIAEILERTRIPETPKQPTEIIIDRIANHPNTQSYRRAYEDYANLDESYSDFGGDNSNALQDFPDTFTYSPITNPYPTPADFLADMKAKKRQAQSQIRRMEKDFPPQTTDITEQDKEKEYTSAERKIDKSQARVQDANEQFSSIKQPSEKKSIFQNLRVLLERNDMYQGGNLSGKKKQQPTPEQRTQTPTLTALGSDNQSQEQNNPLSFEEFQAAQANQNYGHQSLLRSIAKNIREKLTPKVSKDPSGLMHILDPQFHSSSSETLPIIEGISDEDKAFIENLRKTNPKLAAYLESAPTDDEYEALGINKDELLSSRNEQPTTLAPQDQDIPETHLPDTQQETPRLTALSFNPNIDKPNVSHFKPDMQDVTASRFSPNVDKPAISHISQELQKPNVVRGLDGLEDILQPPQRLTALGGQPQETQQKPNADITFDEALRNVAEILYQPYSENPDSDQWFNGKNFDDYFSNLPLDLQKKIDSYMEQNPIISMKLNMLDDGNNTLMYRIDNLDALKDILQNSHQSAQSLHKLLPIKDYMSPSDDLLISQQNNQNLFITSNANMQTVLEAKNDEERRRLLNTLTFDELKAWIDTGLFGGGGDKYTSKNELIDDFIRRISHNEPEPQAPKLTTLNDTQQQKPESDGIAEDLKHIVESNPIKHSKTKLQPVGKPFLDVQDELGRVKQVTNPEAVKIRDSNLQLLNDAENDEERIRLLNTLTHQQLKDMHDSGAFGVNYYQGQTKKDYIDSIIERRNRRIDELRREEEIKKKREQATARTPEHAPAIDDSDYPFNLEDSYQGMPKQELKAAADKNNSLISSIKDEDTLRKRLSRLHVPMLRAMSGISGSGYKKQDFINEIVRVATRPIPDNATLKAGEFSVPGVNGIWTVKPSKAGNTFTISNDDIPHSSMVYDPKEIYFLSLGQLDRDTTGAVQDYFRKYIKDFYEKGGNTSQEDITSQPEPVKKAKPVLSTIHNYTSNEARSAAENNLQMLRNADEKERIRLLGTLDKGQLMNFAQTLKYHGLGDIGGVANGITRIKQNFLRFLNNPVQDSKPVTPQAETTEPQAQEAKPDKSQKAQEEVTPNSASNAEFQPMQWYKNQDGKPFLFIGKSQDGQGGFVDQWGNTLVRNIFTDRIGDKIVSQRILPLDGVSHWIENSLREYSKHVVSSESRFTPDDNLAGKSEDFYRNSWFTKKFLSQQKKNDTEPEQQPQKSHETDTASNDSSMPDTPITRLANRVKARILDALDEKKDITPFSNDDLREWATQEFGGTLGQGAYTQKQAYDAMEMGINMSISEAKFSPANDKYPADFLQNIFALSDILYVIPTQTNRTTEQVEAQQFSTPPTLSYLVNWLANIGKGNTVLEPSAGTGNLAVFAKNAGANLILNDFSESGLRADILDALGWGKVYREDAMQLGNILAGEVRDGERSENDMPDRVVMNPPFSSAWNLGSNNKNQNGFKHVMSALEALRYGGRLVAILSAGRDGSASSVRKWLNGEYEGVASPKGKYNVRALITVDGKAYKKYGTTFSNAVVVIDKTGATPKGGTAEFAFSGDFNNDEEIRNLFEAMQTIRNDIQDRDNSQPRNDSEPPKPEPPKPAPKNDSPKAEAKNETTAPKKSVIPNTLKEAEKILEKLNDASYDELKDTADSLGVDVLSTVGTRDDSDSSRAKLRTAIKKALKADTEPVTQENQTQQEHIQPENNTQTDTDNNSAEAPKKITVSHKSSKELDNERKALREHDEDNSIQSTYTPTIITQSAKHHPADLVESTVMASIPLPNISEKPNIPQFIIDEGRLSDAQMEAVTLAVNSFSHILPNGYRRGFFIGDGTGVGKGREISGIIMDTLSRGAGNGKAIWISNGHTLIMDAKRDWQGLGNNPDDIFPQKGFKAKNPIQQKKGILFTAYSHMASKDRIKQLKEWLGENWDGIIVLDEAHNANNVLGKNAATRAKNTREFIKAFPKARVLYVSATGATKMENFAMLDRLGIWGYDDAPFEDAKAFNDQLSKGGIAAMEVAARDFKAMGLFIARSLSMRAGPYGGDENVTFRTLEHKLSDDEIEIYDSLAEIWQMIEQEMPQIMVARGYDPKKGRDIAKWKSVFWGAHQRFFNQIITSFQTDEAILDMQKQLDAGNSCLVQLTNTLEANLNRAIKKGKQLNNDEDDSADSDFDLSPKDILIEMVNNLFDPRVVQYTTNEDGDEIVEEVKDSSGKPVLSDAVLRKKQTFLDLINSINRFPQSPIDKILSFFGHENVAEITGRSQRPRVFVDKKTGKKSNLESGRTDAVRNAEIDDYNSGKRRILIFSEKGGTGASYHASNDYENKQKRIHYLLQAGWAADKALQGLGRSNRSNEAHKPEYILVTTDIPGQKRFISTIAKRLAQLGALTTGERRTATSGMFSEGDNLEASYVTTALGRFIGHLLAPLTSRENPYPELDPEDVMTQLGYSEEKIKKIDVTDFLNRLLAMTVDMQKMVFARFQQEIDTVKEVYLANGTDIDAPAENVKAISINIIKEQTINHSDLFGTDTNYLELEITRNMNTRTWQEIQSQMNIGVKYRFYALGSGKIVAAVRSGRTYDTETQQMITTYRLVQPDRRKVEYGLTDKILSNSDHKQKRKFTPVDVNTAQALWMTQTDELPDTFTATEHMITGAMLPIWNLIEDHPKVWRITTEDGREFLGRIIPNKQLQKVLQALHVKFEGKKYNADSIKKVLDKRGTIVTLLNKAKLKFSRVSGEKLLEIIPADVFMGRALKRAGLISMIINSKERFFFPKGNDELLNTYLEKYPVAGEPVEIDDADEIIAEAVDTINSSIDASDSGHLHIIHPSFWGFINDPDDNPLIHESNYPMDSEPREYRYQASKNADSSKSAWQHIKEFGAKIWKGRHDIPELADEKGGVDDSLIKAQEWLRGLKRERQANVHETEKQLRSILLGLTPDDFDLFQRAMELRDLNETHSNDPNTDMPWDLNPPVFSMRDPVRENFANIMGHVRKNPRVQEAMKKSDILMEDIRKKLVEAADRLGMFDVRDRLSRKYYFRHLVLEYYNMQRSGKPHPTFKNPTARGYMKHREGSEKDISSNWILAMGEVFTRMFDDIKILDTLFKLREEYDIIEDIRQQAINYNMEHALAKIMRGLQDVPEDLRKAAAEKKLGVALNTTQARAMTRLFNLAKKGDLPVGNKHEWEDLVSRMAEAGQLDNLFAEEQEILSRYIGWLSDLSSSIPARKAAKTFLTGIKSRIRALKSIIGDDYLEWQDLIPEDYTIWSPSDSRLVFSASTLPEYMLKIATENIDALLGADASDIGKMIASGGDKQIWVIPTRLADALDNIGKSQPMGAFGQIMTKMMGAFKRWVTIGPANGRLFKYNWRNFFGDLEAVLQGNPGALYYFKQAAKELTDVMLKGGEATGSLEEFQKRGGGLTTEAMTELERPDRIKEFSHLFEQKKSSNPLKWGVKALREYLYIATTLTNFRESILRYASFLSYIQLIKDNNGVPPFYGMSKPREVKAVGDDIYDIAFKLANENLGAYDQISSNLQWLRDNNFASFLSWVEVNTKRYAQLMANVWQGNSYLEWWIKRKGQKFIDGLIGGGNGNGGNNEPPKSNNGGNFADDDGDNNLRKLFRRVAKKSAVGALRLAITLALAAPLWFMLSIWNMLNGENDEKLPPDVRNKPHLTIGTNASTGEVTYMGDIGSAFDALQMFGVGNLITGDLRDLLDGRISFGELAMNILDGPVSKLVSNANPFAKAVVEGFFGKRTFPSALHPTPIRDKGRFIAQSFGLDWYYDFLTDKPHKPFYDFSSSVVNTSNQDSSAYFYMLSRRKQFEENVLGKSVDAFTMTRRGEALRNAKKAADLGDGKSLRKYLREYFRAGGSEQGLKISARTMEPLYGLNDTDEMRFIRWLPKEERKILRRAMRYAERMKARLGVW